MLSNEEIAIIKKTWEIPRADPTASGSAILIRFFTKYPSNIKYFPFRETPVTELMTSARFKAHCTRIIGTFESTISLLGQDDALPKIKAIWEEIAKTHVQRHHIPRARYAELREAIVEILIEVCKLNAEQQAAWNKLIDIAYGIIFAKMDELGAE